MITLTDKGLEKAQRVRQFFVAQELESYIPSMAFEPREENPSENKEKDSIQDVPAFLKNRSLRRRLDSAFDACYQSQVGTWFKTLIFRQKDSQ